MNNSIFYFFNNFLFQYDWLDSIVWFSAVPLIYIMFFVGAIFIFINYKLYDFKNILKILKVNIRQVIYIPFATAFAWLVSDVLKVAIHTDRPFIAFNDTYTLFSETGFAFPSSHSATAGALAFAVFFVNKRLGYVFMICAVLVGVSRIVAGVHFPIDILGGYLLGFGVAYLLKSR